MTIEKDKVNILLHSNKINNHNHKLFTKKGKKMYIKTFTSTDRERERERKKN